MNRSIENSLSHDFCGDWVWLPAGENTGWTRFGSKPILEYRKRYQQMSRESRRLLKVWRFGYWTALVRKQIILKVLGRFT